jgi:hypothetical protein
MDMSLANAGMAERILFIFAIQECIRPRSVLIESERFSSKDTHPSNGLQNTIWRLSRKQSQYFYDNSFPKYDCISGIFSIVTLRALGSETRCVVFVEIVLPFGRIHCSVFSNQQWRTEQQSVLYRR